MAWVWTAVGLPGLVAGIVVCTMAGLIFFARPDRLQNRYLASALFLEGALIGTGCGLMYSTDSAAATRAWQIVSILLTLPLPFVYLLFLSTLDTALARPLRHRAVRWCLGIAAAVAPLAYYAYPLQFVRGTYAWTYAPWQADTGPAFPLLLLAIGVLNLLALCFVVSAFRRARRGTMARKTQWAFLVSFLLRDGIFGFLLVSYGLGIRYTDGLDGIVLPAVGAMVYIPVLAYGVLKTQLFDIDLRLKWTLNRSTLAAVFFVVFLVVQELVELVLPVDGTMAGLFGAVALGVAFRPLDRLTTGLADTLMPQVRPTPDYLEARKLEVYRAALEGAITDGTVSSKERTMLERLQVELAIAGTDVERLESDVLRAAPARGAMGAMV